MSNLTWVAMEIHLVVDLETNTTSTVSIRNNTGTQPASPFPNLPWLSMNSAMAKTDTLYATSTLEVSGHITTSMRPTFTYARNYNLGTATQTSVGPNLTV